MMRSTPVIVVEVFIFDDKTKSVRSCSPREREVIFLPVFSENLPRNTTAINRDTLIAIPVLIVCCIIRNRSVSQIGRGSKRVAAIETVPVARCIELWYSQHNVRCTAAAAPGWHLPGLSYATYEFLYTWCSNI